MRTLTLLAVLAASVAILPGQESLKVTGLRPEDPLSLTASATPAELVVEVKLDPEWHLYARDTGGGQPVELEVLDGSAFGAAGAPEVPSDDNGEIHGEAKLVLPLRRVAKGAALKVRFRFMACDPLMCLPPMEVMIEGKVGGGVAERLDVLLVVKELGERSARIAGFLDERGFGCAVVPYAEVTREQCDSHDVVLADSPYFEDARGAFEQAKAFPRTGSPIVAVGFLGTVLLEAHRIAMACGYI